MAVLIALAGAGNGDLGAEGRGGGGVEGDLGAVMAHLEEVDVARVARGNHLGGLVLLGVSREQGREAAAATAIAQAHLQRVRIGVAGGGPVGPDDPELEAAHVEHVAVAELLGGAAREPGRLARELPGHGRRDALPH